MNNPTDVPKGFVSITGNVGLKDSDDDCLMVASLAQCTSAAVFTQSLFAGASVQLSRKVAEENDIQGIVVLSKNANVATGATGLRDAIEVQHLASRALGLRPDQVLIASTGVIGAPYPMSQIRRGIADITPSPPLPLLHPERAARAIMTTDTRPKVVTARCGSSTITGIAKGVGMIEPNMATLLTFFFTDANIDRVRLQKTFTGVIDRTFNALSIDTDTSTSDTAAILANGLAGEVDEEEFTAALHDCALSLVQQIVRDGEGATKAITVKVTGARTDQQAKLVGKTVVNSPLVKTAIHGGDPNWGRVVMAIGKLSDQTDIDPGRVAIAFGDIPVYPARGNTTDESLRRFLAGTDVEIDIDLGIGQGAFTVYGCDLSDGYIRINADYTT